MNVSYNPTNHFHCAYFLFISFISSKEITSLKSEVTTTNFIKWIQLVCLSSKWWRHIYNRGKKTTTIKHVITCEIRFVSPVTHERCTLPPHTGHQNHFFVSRNLFFPFERVNTDTLNMCFRCHNNIRIRIVSCSTQQSEEKSFAEVLTAHSCANRYWGTRYDNVIFTVTAECAIFHAV